MGGGGSLNLEIRRGGGLKQFWKSRWEGGSKNHAFCREGVDFFWNNPLVDFDPFCVFLFQGSLLVIVIMIDGSEKTNCEGSF